MQDERSLHERAAAEIWQWQPDPLRIDTLPLRTIRQQGLLRSLLIFLIATAVYFFFSKTASAFVFFMAIITATAATFSPTGLYSAMNRAANALTRGIGVTAQRVVLPVIFLTLMTPCRLLFRRGNRSILKLRPDPACQSYWEKSGSNIPQREKQF